MATWLPSAARSRSAGTVTGDVLALPARSRSTGRLEATFGPAGGRLLLAGPVAEDVLAAGGQVELSSGGSIGGDLIAAGGQLTVAGSVTGSVEGRAGTYERSGSVGGSEHVVIGSNDAAVREVFAGNAVLDAIRQLVALVLFGALAIWLVPRLLRSAEGTVRRRPAAALGGGLLAMAGYIGFLIAAILLMVLLAIVLGLLRLGSLLGIELIGTLLAIGVVSFGFLLAVAFVGDVVVALALGRLLASDPLRSRWQELGLLIAGAVVVVIATSLPYVGGLLKLGVVVLGLGAWRWWPGTHGAAGGWRAAGKRHRRDRSPSLVRRPGRVACLLQRRPGLLPCLAVAQALLDASLPILVLGACL